ncbi:hypothetical protein GWI33_019585 [Rhynchophorus ferrugineus]|uniref:FAT domain-containing protein n=1 Tax=Rhynchophorus ferrugineus TaxID=354439 RepID=A0A834M6W2_RHYFE|nr:hypothetical protein GWI33_019585 [Rhynchophorus ferrugineus]
MDLEPHNIFSYLAEQRKNDNNHECLRILTSLNQNLITEQISSSVLDKYLLYMFSKKNGLFPFINSVLSKRQFEETVIQSIEIISVFINNFSDKLENYILDINENSVKILMSNTSAIIKVKTADIILLSLVKINKYIGNENAYQKIFRKIFQQCDTHIDTVKSKEYEILGAFAEYYHYIINDKRETINLQYFTSRITDQLSKRKQSVVASLFIGLEYYCNGCVINNTDDLHLRNLYQQIKTLSNTKSLGAVRKANKAAMHFFGKHIKLFITYIIEESTWQNWHKRIYKDWFNLGVDDRKVAEYTLIQFFLCMSESLFEMKEDSCLPVLKHFVSWSEGLLMESIKNRKLGLQCLKYFSKPLYKHNYEEFKRIFLTIMQNFERNYIINESDNEATDILPDYIQCIASFIRFHNVTTMEFHCLQRAIINMIKNFHKVKPLYHFYVINSTMNSFLYLKSTTYFKDYVKQVIYHGVIWSCSHQHIVDSEFPEESNKIVTVKDYFPFWRGLLKSTPNMYNANFHEINYILICIVQELVNTLMVLTIKLNINMILTGTPYTQIETSYQLEQENDYAIFLNVIDLYEDILNHINPEMLRTCICNLIITITKKCLKFQFVSGFYKLLSLMLNIGNNLKLFTEEKEEIKNCREILMNFVPKLIRKMKQFKDELLISCLRVLVEIPATLIEPFLDECIGLFKTVFELGRSYIPLANLGLTALEQWQKVMPKEDFDDFAVNIVPYLDSYLRSVSLGHLTKADYKTKSRKTAQKLNKRKILLEIEPELLKFQRRILNFIGCQDMKVCQAFTSIDHNMDKKITSANYHLKLSLPYENHTLDIYLEPFAMRIIELSLHSSDRKIRLMACEVLQGIITIFLGKTVSIQDTLHSDLESLWKSICVALLQLACDVDETVKQIFQPLFYQLIHWYTSPSKRETKHSAVLIDVLMDGITHPRNASLRDFSGISFKEFVKWTIKQSKSKDLEKDPIYIKLLVKKIRYFSTLPDTMKKLGAALIFNNIYQEFQREPPLVSIFSIELLHIFLTSLSLIDDTSDEEEFIVPQIKKSILILQGIFEKSSHIFLKNSKRRIPSAIGKNGMNDVIKWIFEMTGSTSTIARRISMNLFIKLAPIYTSEDDLAQFVKSNFENALIIYEVLEDTNCITKWLQSFLRLLDGYLFIIKNSLLSVDLNNQKSIICNLIREFRLTNYEGKNNQKYLTLKSSCSLAILKLSVTLLEDPNMLNRCESFWNNDVWMIIINCMFETDHLNDVQNNTEYNNTLTKFLNVLSKTSNVSSDFIKKARDYVVERFSKEVVPNLKGPVSRKLRMLLKGLIMIQRSELDMYFKSESFSQGVADRIMNLYLEYKNDTVIFVWELSDSVVEYIKLLLEFGLSNINELQILFKHLLCNFTVSYSKSANNELFGVYMFKTFDNVLVHVVKHFNLFLESNRNVEQLTKLTIYVIDYVKDNNLQIDFPNFSKSILDGWVVFQRYFDEGAISLGLQFVMHFYRAFGDSLDINNYTLLNWAMKLTIDDSETQDRLTLYMDIFYTAASTHTDSEETTKLIRNLIKRIENEVESKENSPTKRIILDKMLAILPQIKNYIIFEYFINNCHDQDNSEQEMTSSLETFMYNNNVKHQSVLLITYQTIRNENNFNKKMFLTKEILYPILIYSNYADCMLFLNQHLGTALEENLVDYGNGILTLLLIEILFLKAPSNVLEDNQLIKEQFGVSNLTKQVLKLVLDAFRLTENTGDKIEQLRQYKCSAYKTFASIVANFNKASNFLNKLFIRQENNRDILWNAVIDTNIVYTFSVDFNSYPKNKKNLISFKQHIEKNEEENNILRYIESPMLFNSSLSEDVTKYDFTSTILRHNKNNVLNESNVQKGVVYLESTDLNKHELMATVCGLIEDIFNKGINKLPVENEHFVEFPNWMEGIRKLLLDPSTHKNVKLFWIKVIQNKNNIFKHFAAYFIKPLLQFLIDKVAGDDLNYYVTDVVTILVQWSKDVVLTEENAKLASMVLEMLMDMLVNERKDIYKNNLKLIDSLAKYWKSIIKFPHRAVLKRLYQTENQEIEIGLHLCLMFLVNELSPCEESEFANFWKKLYEILSLPNSAIFKICAEVIGLMLNHQKNNENIFQISNEITKTLLKYENDKYANALEGIVAHYPDILDNRHFVAIFNKLHNSNCTLQTTFLRIILKGAEFLQIYSDFRNESWCTLLKSQHDEVRLITLEIMLKTFSIIKEEDVFVDIIKTIIDSLFYANGVFRVRTFTLMMDIYKQVKRNDIKEICREALVQGLSDNSIEIRDRIWKFWEENENIFIPSNIVEKFIFLMEKFYIPKVEDQFLGNMGYYLLSSLKHEELDKPLFDNPLQDCKFEDYVLTTHWKLQHQSVVPMFAKTARSFSKSAALPSTSSTYNQIRVTQEKLSFIPTQNPAWDNYLYNVTSLNSGILKPNNEFLDSNQIQSTKEFQQKKIRFLKDKSKTADYFANKATTEKIQKHEKRYQSAKEREKQVTLYRSYRIGDLPDIQITLKSIITPLRMLILHDGEIAKVFISFIYKTILKQISNEGEDFVEKLFNCIKSIFHHSTHFNNTLFSTLLEILLFSKDRCRALLLEDYVVLLDAEPNGPKKGILADDEKMACWVKLAELYKDMQEWDMVKTIFVEKTNCNDLIQKALLFESEKKWRSARDSYMELLKTDLVPERQDFYFESCFKCLANLGEWETLPDAVKSTMPGDNDSVWDVLWTSNWYQQKILPWYIEAHIKTALFSENMSEEFLENINKSLEDSYQGDYLRNTFCEELCILWIINNEISYAQDISKSSLDNFLRDWQLINPLFENLRFNKILNLRQIVDIGRFLDTETKSFNNMDENNIMDLLNYWKRTQREYLPTVTMSESKLLYRKTFINFLLNKTNYFTNGDELRKTLESTKLFLDVSFMNAAIDEGNFWLAKKYAKKYSSNYSTNSDLMLIYGNICYLSSQLVSSDQIEYTVDKMLKALNQFKLTFESGHESLKSMLRFFDISLQLSGILRRNPELFQNIEQSLIKVFDEPVTLSVDLIAKEKLKNLVLTNCENSTSESEDILKEAYVRLAYFAQNEVDQKQDFTRYVLRAMRLGSKEGRQLFPCILLECQLENKLTQVFIEETKTIPTWMFLGWIPQILAIVDSNKVTAISEIILRIAKTYPQAIMYVYRLSKDNYKYTNCLKQNEVNDLIKKLDELLLCYPIVDTFLEALANVTSTSRLHHIYREIRKSNSIDEILNWKDRVLRERQKNPSESLKGDFLKIVKPFYDVLNKIDQSQNVTDIQKMLERLSLSHYNNRGGPLTNYSPWLADFSTTRVNMDLEIPGQYTGDKMPLAEHHIKISRFGDNVSI